MNKHVFTRVLRAAIVLAGLALTFPALSQSQTVRQSGTITPRHAACWTSTGVIQDCGTAAIPFATSLGTLGQGPTICANSAVSTAPFARLCLSANTNSNAEILLTTGNGATAAGIQFNVNGTVVPFPSPSAPLPIGFGGTGATTAAGARTNLGLGTMAVQDATAVAILGGTITGMPVPTDSADVANKAYVDNTALGLNPLAQSRLATAAVLPNSPTYSNGTAGVGATLTAGSNTTLTVDGTLVALNNIILVKDQVSTFQNGQYYASVAGSGGAPWVLTRCTVAACGIEYDTAATMKRGSYTYVSAGSANLSTQWIQSTSVTTVGSDAVSYVLFSGTTVTSFNSRSGAVTPQTGDYSVAQVTNAASLAYVQANASVCGSIEGLFANNSQVSQPDTNNIMVITAKCLSLYNPNTGVRRGYGYGTVTANLTADIRNAGPVAGGRDQAAAFVAHDIVFFYHIAGTAGLNVIVSKTCPSCSNGATIGPVLPANYDTYRYDFPMILSDAANLIFDSRHNDEGSRCTFTGSIATTTLTVSAPQADCSVSAGHNIAIGKIIRCSGSTLDTRVTAMSPTAPYTGTGLAGTYQVSKSQTVSAGPCESTDEGVGATIIVGNYAYFNVSKLVNLTGAVLWDAIFNWDYSIYVPTTNAATAIDVQLDFEVSAAGSQTTSGFFVYNQSQSSPCIGSQAAVGVYSTYAYGANLAFAYNPNIRVPVICAFLMPIATIQAGGTANTPPVTVLFIQGYQF